MKKTTFLAGGMTALAACSAWAGAWEAYPAEAKSLGSAKRIMVVAIGKEDPFLGSLTAAHEGKVQDRGYEGPAVQRAAGYSVVWPKFKSLDDAKDWLKDGHKVRVQSGSTGKVGGAAALVNLASNAIKSECKLDGLLAVETRELGAGAKKKVFGALSKKMGMGQKASPSASYESRVTLLNEKGAVVWSAVEEVDKETLDKRAEEAGDKRLDEMQGKMEAQQKDVQAQMAGQQGAAGNKAMEEQMAKMTPEQRAMALQAMQNSQSAQAGMPGGQGGMMKSMMKMTNSMNKRELGGPEEWGPLASEAAWAELGTQLPKLN